MRIEWIGHACFRIVTEDGTRIITDPYDESVGIAMLPLEADVITMSHGHHDHCETSQIQGQPVILRGDAPYRASGLEIRALTSYHDDAQGALRGENAIRVIRADGVTLVHMGDQGCMPQERILAEIEAADVMLIPVGGTYTLDAAGAKAVIERAKPRCVVPMHVKTAHCPYPIAPVGAFLAAMGCEGIAPVDELKIGKNAAQGVVLMQPQADTL